MSDSDLLQQYLETACNSHFEAIVQKYGGLVLGTAMRQIGNRALAEDVTQLVFTTLAQRAERIRKPHHLGAWLHRTTLFHCANAVRKESKRRQKMELYRQQLNPDSQAAPIDHERWEETLPVLDRAIDALKPSDRDLVIMRFYERRTYSAMGALLQKSEDACRKQTDRALEKLSRHLKQQGVAIPGAMLTAGLSHFIAEGITPAHAAAISQTALTTAGAASSAPVIQTLSSLLAMTKTTTISLAAVAFLAPIGVQIVGNHRTMPSSRSTIGTLTPDLPSEREASTTNSVAIDSKPGRSAEELAQVMRHLAEHPNPDHARADLCRFLLTLSREELPRAMQTLPKVRGKNDRRAIANALFTRWVSFDPREALDNATKLSDAHHAFGAEWGAIVAWVAQDRTKAMAWIDNLPDGDRKEHLLGVYWYGFGRAFPAAAADAAKGLNNVDARHKRLESIMRQWRDRDPEEAIAWLREFEDGARRDQWLDAVVNTLSFSRPQTAFEHAKELFAGYHQQRVLTNVLGSWAYTEPRAAFYQMLELPVKMRSSDMEEKLGVEIRDIELAGEFLGKLLEQGDGNDFIVGLARGARYGRYAGQPEAYATLFDFAKALPDSNMRSSATVNIASGWLAADPDAARSWIEESDALGKEVRERLLNSSKSP